MNGFFRARLMYGKAEQRLFLVVLVVAFALCGCAGPIGVTRVSPQDSYRIINDNAIGSGDISDSTKTVLQRYNLRLSLAEDPLKTIGILHDISKTDDRRDLLFALSELCYQQGALLMEGASDEERRYAQDLFLQASVYAYYFLLEEDPELSPSAFDSRFRAACDLYNRALARAFPVKPSGGLEFSSGTRNLPAGKLELFVAKEGPGYSFENFQELIPSDDFAVRGFTVRTRMPGLGLPLVGMIQTTPESTDSGVLPVTAFLRLPGNFRAYSQGKSTATLELYSAHDHVTITVNNRSLPLETDITTPLAYKLDESDSWNLGTKRFLTGTGINSRIILLQPYEYGRIPVVFVHGTASSPVWWAEMLNSLRADANLRKYFQFWFYQYNSSKIVTLSAAELRESITAMVNQLDPQQRDPALQNMVVIGHSQGGLLTKMTVVDPGETLWHALSDEPLEVMQIDASIKELVHRLLFFKPLPSVTRVVFISTPHRGSYLANNWVRELLRKVVTLPYNAVLYSQDFFASLSTRLKLPGSIKGQIPTSVDGMSKDNPMLAALASLPIVEGVTAHSIIAVKPGMDIETGNDGVVEFASAQLPGVESEFIVRAGHSCQDHPYTIEEVRRILLAHVGINNAWRVPAE